MSEERTEAPTQRRLQRLHAQGQGAKSADLTSALSLLVAVLAIQQVGPLAVSRAVDGLRSSLTLMARSDFSAGDLPGLWQPMGAAMLLMVVGVVAPVATVAVAAGLFQIRGRLALGALRPNSGRLNPASGWRRVVSRDGFVNLLWPLLKLTVMALAVEGPARDALNNLPTSVSGGVGFQTAALGDALLATGRNGAAAFVVLGALDYLYRRRQFLQQARMSKKELRDDLRETEGDPMIRGRMRALRRRMAQRRMLHAVPKAQVVVVNPTHYAVALSYEPKKMAAPTVVAKGVDFLAQRIIEVARANRVPVVPSPPLARALYGSVEIGEPIPVSLYQAIAEILAQVYSLRRRR